MSLYNNMNNIRKPPPVLKQPATVQVKPGTVQVKPGTFQVDESVWSAVAGTGVNIAGGKSYVYYFPQGHLEQLDASSLANNHNFTIMLPMIYCQVTYVHLLFDPVSDQSFVKFVLQPIRTLMSGDNGGGGGDRRIPSDDFFSVAKILTPSDANNGCGFSVTKFCADKIFPKLDYGKDPPAKNLLLTDTLNFPWEFRYIFGGTPRRHLLTTGWSKFVNAKKLISGDSVVFMSRKSTNELFIGVRRSKKFSGSGEGYGGKEVVKEIEKAVRGIAFEVTYYPKIGVPNFVVLAEKVEMSRQMQWIEGMSVRMAVENDDSEGMTWIQGVVAAAEPPASGAWRGSPWRMLQVKWDRPEISRNMNKVSPWEVKCIPLLPVFDTVFPSLKRSRLVNEYGMRTIDDVPVEDPPMECSVPPLTGLSNSAFPNYSGKQRVRRGKTATNAFASTGANFDDPRGKGVAREESIGVSTGQTIGSSNLVVGPPSDGQPSSSFQLFGMTIRERAPENGEGCSYRNGSC